MTTQERIRELNERGLQVRVSHLRRARLGAGEPTQMPAHFARKLKLPIEPNGGMTIVEIGAPAGHPAAIGYTRVHLNDNFNRKLGLRIALERAVSQL